MRIDDLPGGAMSESADAGYQIAVETLYRSCAINNNSLVIWHVEP